MRAHSRFTLAGEEAHQFVRPELPLALGPNGDKQREAVELRWAKLRTGLRKAYNEVAIFGAEQPPAAGREIWRLARNGCNDFLRDLPSSRPDSSDQTALTQPLTEIPAQEMTNPVYSSHDQRPEQDRPYSAPEQSARSA